MRIQIELGASELAPNPLGTVTDGSGSRDVFHVEFDPATDSIVDVVVNSVASIHNVEPVELGPLSASVDPEMLERVVDQDANRELRGADVSFEYEGLVVTVTASGNLWLEWD